MMKKRILFCLVMCLMALTFTLAAAETVEVYGIKMDLPYSDNGLTITDVTGSGWHSLKFTVRNDTGKAVTNYSSISVKCLDASNVVLESRSFYMDDMNAGDYCYATLYFPSMTKSIKFNGASVYEDDGSDAYGSIQTEVVGKMAFNTPYERDGLSFKVDKSNSNQIWVYVTNTTDVAFDRTYVEYRSFDKNGVVMDSSSFGVPSMDPGETVYATFRTKTNAKTVLFGKVSTYEGEACGEVAVEKIRNFTVNTLPADLGGITLTKAGLSGKRVEISYTNNTGIPLSSSTHFSYKEYNKDGYCTDSGNVYVNDMNPGESGSKTVYVSSTTTKVVFYNPVLVEGEYVERPETTTVRGVEINVTPYETNGLCIESLTVSGSKVVCKIRNTSGAAIQSGSIDYRCLDKNDQVKGTSSIYVNALNAGEVYEATMYMTSGSKKVFFGEGRTYEGEALDTNVPMNTLRKKLQGNLPLTVSGLTFELKSTTKSHLKVTVTNNTGSAVGGYSYVPYRVYDSNGVVLYSSNAYLEDIENGQSCLIEFYAEQNAVKIVIGTPVIR